MRVLILSLDKKVLERDSAVQRRLLSLSEAAGGIAVFVSGTEDRMEHISENLAVYSFGGTKVMQWWKMRRRAQSLILNPSSLTPEPPLNLPLGKGGEASRPFDLITVQDTSYLAFLAYLLARQFRIPLEVQVHGLEKFSGVRRTLARFVLRRADKVRVVSERLKRELDLRFKIKDLSKIYELPVYTQVESFILNPSSLTQRRRKTVLSLLQKGERGEEQSFTFLTVGRLVPVKNMVLQIRAFAKLVNKFPQARLQIVGDGPLRDSLKLQVLSFKLEDKIEFLGQQIEISRFYEEADAFLLTSDYEGWGLVVTEAAAHGLPIIMTDVGLAGEFIKNGESGLVIPVGDEDALVSAMKLVIEDADLRARLGEAARRSFLALPSKEEQIRKQVKEWRSLR